MSKELTVSEYLNLVNETLGLIPSREITVIGEVSDFRISQGKWVNFALKDEEQEAKIACFTVAQKLHQPIEDGMKVAVVGYPKIYERFGNFSLNIQSIQLVGEGALARAYEMLKKKLQQEGLFDPSRKRSLPRFPSSIGLITSGEAAAYGDFLRILNNRWTGVEVIHAPVHVQGKLAVDDIVAAFEAFTSLEESERPEVLVLTRGGGSLEDLHAFNDEQVARAVFHSPIPVIVGVGHERDESLADFVADIRASTPSNAAERIVPDRTEILRSITRSTDYAYDQIMNEVRHRTQRIDRSLITLRTFIERAMQNIRLTVERFRHAFDRFRISLVATRQHIERNQSLTLERYEHVVNTARQRTDALIRLFKQFDVQHMLNRGFSIVRQDGHIVRDASKLANNAALQLQLATGKADVVVTETEKSS